MGINRINLQEGKNNVTLVINVIPRARNNVIAEIMSDGTIKIKLSAQPVEGRANNALIKYLARILNTSSSNIKILSGFSTRKKLVSISDIDSETIQQRILKHLERKHLAY